MAAMQENVVLFLEMYPELFGEEMPGCLCLFELVKIVYPVIYYYVHIYILILFLFFLLEYS